MPFFKAMKFLPFKAVRRRRRLPVSGQTVRFIATEANQNLIIGMVRDKSIFRR